MVGGIYSFGNEFKLAESTDDEISTLVANFSGNETAGYYGRGILTVQLFGSDGNIINSANVKVKITDSNSQEPFTPSVVFRDQILDAVNGFDEKVEEKTTQSITEINAAKTEKVAEAETEITEAKTSALGEIETAGANAVNEVNAATEAAKAVIDGWTEQSARLANAESAISLLQADKLNRGALWFNKAKLTTATNNATTLPLTLCLTYDCDDWSAVVGKTFQGGAITILNTFYVSSWTTTQFNGFCLGIFNATGNAGETHIAAYLANLNAGNSRALNYVAFNKATGKHTICVSISEVANFAVNFYQDGAFLATKTSKPTTMTDNIGGTSGINICASNYATTIGQTVIPNFKLSRLKIFNCVLPATKADDTDGIGYTVEDYHNGIDEPPTMQDASATYRALLSLQDYTITNGSTQQVFDVSGNANDATAMLSDGGSLKGSNDIGVSRLIDFIKGQSA